MIINRKSIHNEVFWEFKRLCGFWPKKTQIIDLPICGKDEYPDEAHNLVHVSATLTPATTSKKVA